MYFAMSYIKAINFRIAYVLLLYRSLLVIYDVTCCREKRLSFSLFLYAPDCKLSKSRIGSVEDLAHASIGSLEHISMCATCVE